jgi:predicted CopG family antitoxin
MVKVISLSNKAYETLKELKVGNDSFSDVVIKLTHKKSNLLSLFGCAKGDKKFISGLNKAYQEREKENLKVY